MGKGTTHKCDWKPTTLDAAIAAMKLHAHTAKILSNPKAFNPANDFHNRTLLAAFEQTLEIYRRCYEANEINVDESWSCMWSCMVKGRNRSLVRRMDDFVNSLKEEIHAETQYQTDRAA